MKHDIGTLDGIIDARTELVTALWDRAMSGDLQAAEIALVGLNAQARDLADGMPKGGRVATVRFPKPTLASKE